MVLHVVVYTIHKNMLLEEKENVNMPNQGYLASHHCPTHVQMCTLSPISIHAPVFVKVNYLLMPYHLQVYSSLLVPSQTSLHQASPLSPSRSLHFRFSNLQAVL